MTILRRVNYLVPEKIKLYAARLRRFLPLTPAHIIFHPTFACNYRCGYCSNRGLQAPPVSWREWLEIFEKLPPSSVTISGGEPLLYNGLEELLRVFPAKHVISQVVTNLSLDADAFIRLKKTGLRVMASFHPSFAVMESFGDKAKRLRDEGVNIIVTCVANQDNIKNYAYYKNYFQNKLKLFFKMDSYEDFTGNDAKVSLQGLSIYGENYIFNKDKFNTTSQKKCFGGSKFFIFTPDMGVYRCYSGLKYHNFPASHDAEKFFLGNLKKGSFKIDKNRFFCGLPCKSICDIELAGVRIWR